MNGLTLRISKGGGKKSKNSISFAPLDISKHIDEKLCSKNPNFMEFSKSSSIDEQLVKLKNILEERDSSVEEDTVKFCTVVFFEADTKHPVKCFIVRYITKTPALHNKFSVLLSNLILSRINEQHANYKCYIRTATKLSACIENFPAGANAMKLIEVELCKYLNQCLESCMMELRNSKQLSPTEKNEIFNLAHLCLRLQLHILQKVEQNNTSKLNSMCNDLKLYIKELLFDEDVPMDTKTLCGIVYVTIYLLENGPSAWIDLLQPSQDVNLRNLLAIESSQLSLYSAIFTVVPVDQLQYENMEGVSAILTLTRRILDIGERSSSDSIFTLGLTRTLLQITKTLDKLTEDVTGLAIVDLVLMFVWSHLEHYMDSVRHLTAQILSLVVKYCSKLDKKGQHQALNNLFTALTALDRSRKSYYVSLTALTVELGAAVIFDKLPDTISDVISALSFQAVQASATTTLEILLQKHKETTSTETLYKMWIQPIMSYVATNSLESGVLNVLENILAKAVKLDEGVINFILPHIKQSHNSDLKCILMLVGVARKAGVGNTGSLDEWRGLVRYDVLKMAAIHHVDETRILSLSLIVESPKTTEVFARGDLDLVLWYLKYNINAQSPNFRQLTLSLMKKFVKRLEDSYKLFKKQNPESDYYITFVEDLRKQCFESLIDGANYSRRFVALQVLLWCEQIGLDGYQTTWIPEYVDTLLLHLEDSYENNKALALQILDSCPVELLQIKTYPASLKIENIMQQASSLKPTDCVSAAYKLNLLKNKLPEYVLDGNKCNTPEVVTYALLDRLHNALSLELEICIKSIVVGAVKGPMYGIIHCMGALIRGVDVTAISQDPDWKRLIADLICTCIKINDAVASVVNNSSPEGHLPMDMGGVRVTDYGNSGGVRLEDGRQVTSQMVLLCAWRSVKEVSLLLGEISSRLTIADEDDCGTIDHQQMLAIGEHFTKLLAETKHRGAFEQAYVGFAKLLARLWRCRSPSLHELPRSWLSELMSAMSSGDKRGVLCATRRSAGLPFMIQALVTTELQVQQNPKCFHECITTLLRLAKHNLKESPNNVDHKSDQNLLENDRNNIDLVKENVEGDLEENKDGNVETRTHCINILRALFRNSALEESVTAYVGEGLLVALEGFEGRTWMERNSSTLLFSALMVRIFGVQRSKDSDTLCVRNRMTGRIFFLRYPHLYDFMLDKLKEVSSSADSYVLRPSLYPILLLLARLYPSSLEGTVSNLKLVEFIPHVLSCARSSVLKTRLLAAKAMVPLISPEQYAIHLETMLNIISNEIIKRNYCHGILLQIIRLLDAKPETLTIDGEVNSRLHKCMKNTQWILQQALGKYPCYMIVDEYVKVVNLICCKLPSILDENILDVKINYLEELIFNENHSKITSGREVCLFHAFYLYVILLNINGRTEHVCDIILKGLKHATYDVTLAVLNYILILNKELEIDSRFLENLSLKSKETVLEVLRKRNNYIATLCDVFKNSQYLECTQKSLKILTLECDTEKYIIEIKTNNKSSEMTNDFVIEKLIDYVKKEHENLTHVYLECLLNFVSKTLRNSNINQNILLEVIRIIFECSSSDNSVNTRSVVVKFLENNCDFLINLALDKLNDKLKFEYKATVFTTLCRLLEDDDVTIRQCTSNIISSLSKLHSKVISTKSSELLADLIERDGVPMLSVMALMDFKSEVCLTDEVSDECRVFDQNERYNIYLEETIWTKSCAERITKLNQSTSSNLQFVLQMLNNNIYKNTFDKLCNNNLCLFKKIISNNEISRNEIMNPKVGLLIKVLG